MQSVAALWNDMWFLTRQPEAEAQWFETHWTIVLFVLLGRDDWQRSRDHVGVWMRGLERGRRLRGGRVR